MRFQHIINGTFLPLISATMISCGGVKNPQLAMCQALAKDLSGGGISQWNSISENDTDRMRTVLIKYTSDAGSLGSIKCDYPRDTTTGTTETGPRQVVHNGVRVETRALIASAGRVSKAMLTQAAELTASKATSLANDALDTAKDAAKTLQQ